MGEEDDGGLFPERGYVLTPEERDKLNRTIALHGQIIPPAGKPSFQSVYSYSGFTDEQRVWAEAKEREIWDLYQEAKPRLQRIGEILNEAKVYLQHGQFSHWRQAAFPYLPVRSSTRYMKLAKMANVADFTEADVEARKKKADEEFKKVAKARKKKTRKRAEAAAKFLDYLNRYMPAKQYRNALAALEKTNLREIQLEHHAREDRKLDYAANQKLLGECYPNGLFGENESVGERPLATDEFWEGPTDPETKRPILWK
ncbi:hypothetical protein ACWIEX_19870 [Bosea sp. NPDC055353]